MKVNYKAKLAAAALIAGLWSAPLGVNAAALSPLDLGAMDQVVVTAQSNQDTVVTSAPSLHTKESNIKQSGEESQAVKVPAYMKTLEESQAKLATSNGVRPRLVSSNMILTDNTSIQLPKNVTVFDFKRIVTPSGVVNGLSLAPAITKNEIYQNHIRHMAKPEVANIPELANFEGQVYRDWNAYQLQGETKEAYHTAYVVEFALGPDFIKGQRAELAINKALFEKSLKKKQQLNSYHTNSVVDEAVSSGTVSMGTNYIATMAELSSMAIAGDERNRTKNEVTEETVAALVDQSIKQQAALLAPYPETYDKESFYKASVKSLSGAQHISDATAANELIRIYKNTLGLIVVAELEHQIQLLEQKPVLHVFEQKKLQKLKRFYVEVNKFLKTSDIQFDVVKNEEIKSEEFGPMIRSTSRGALYFDSYEVPFNIESLIRFDEKGPVVTTIFANDGDANYWQKQIDEIWRIGKESTRIKSDFTMNLQVPQSLRNTKSQIAFNGAVNHVTLPGIDATSMSVKKLSHTVIIPYLFETYEADLVKAIADGPELRHWRTNQLLTGDALKQSQKNYENLVKRAKQIEDYRLGEKTEVYQWQLQDKEGRKTALVGALALTPQTTKQMVGMWQEGILDSQLPVLNQQWLAGEGRLNEKITQWVSFVQANEHIYHEVKLVDQKPIRKIKDSKVPVYTASTRVLVNVNGFALPYYVQAAVVLSKETPVAYVMLTSDKEGTTFAPQFESFVKALS